MILQIDNNNYIVGYATVGGIDGGIAVDDSLLQQIDPTKIGYYTYIGGVINFDTQKYDAANAVQHSEDIRARRAYECFVYVDRGKLWYDKLTQSQLTLLKTWYDDWLDAPETKVVPMFLDFLV